MSCEQREISKCNTLLYVLLKPKINAMLLTKLWIRNSQKHLRYYLNDLALHLNKLQTDKSLLEDHTIENVYRIVQIKTKKNVNITYYLSTLKLQQQMYRHRNNHRFNTGQLPC